MQLAAGVALDAHGMHRLGPHRLTPATQLAEPVDVAGAEGVNAGVPGLGGLGGGMGVDQGNPVGRALQGQGQGGAIQATADDGNIELQGGRHARTPNIILRAKSCLRGGSRSMAVSASPRAWPRTGRSLAKASTRRSVMATLPETSQRREAA